MTPEAQRLAIAEACGWNMELPPESARGDLAAHLSRGV